MNRHEMSLILQDVRKAYRLLADYQQKICELLTFIKDEIGAEHYSYYMHNHIDPRYLYNKFYTGNENIGRGFLPIAFILAKDTVCSRRAGMAKSSSARRFSV